MTAAVMPYRTAVLPWTGSSNDERRFRRILGQVMLLCLLVGLAIQLLPVPKVDREQPEELSPRLAKMLLEHQPPNDLDSRSSRCHKYAQPLDYQRSSHDV